MKNRLHESIYRCFFLCMRYTVVMAIDVIPVIMYNSESLNKKKIATTTSFPFVSLGREYFFLYFNIYININKKKAATIAGIERRKMNDI